MKTIALFDQWLQNKVTYGIEPPNLGLTDAILSLSLKNVRQNKNSHQANDNTLSFLTHPSTANHLPPFTTKIELSCM